MKNLTIKKLTDESVDRAERYIHTDGGIQVWDEAAWMMALMGEVGEAANMLKKVKRGSLKWNKKTKKEVAHELADIQCYLVLLAARLEIDLTDAVIEKFNLVSKKYKAHNKL